MLKSDLIEKINVKQTHFTHRDITLAVNLVLDSMVDHIGKKGRIEIRGFGSLSLHYRGPRRAHNPKTGERLMTKPKFAAHFKPGKEMRERINASRHIPIKEVDEQEE